MTPGSPPSELSVPLSSLAVSVPSMALSPSGEEERPLLLLNKLRARDEQRRTSAHYNHGLMAHSLPPSPLLTKDAGEHVDAAGSQVRPPGDSDPDTSSGNLPENRKAVEVESSCESLLSDQLTDELQGDEMPFITMVSLSAPNSSRTNPTAPPADLQDESFCQL